jgi:hypothetical protein
MPYPLCKPTKNGVEVMIWDYPFGIKTFPEKPIGRFQMDSHELFVWL